MIKNDLIQKGFKLIETTDLHELADQFEKWKEDILSYARDKDERVVLSLHLVDIPYQSTEERVNKYHTCIKKTLNILVQDASHKKEKTDALETIIDNFGLYLKNMFLIRPENKATLKKEILQQIKIHNEYDIQHIMYAVIKALYPNARREVNQDTGYGTVRYDIVIEEINTIIEIKCTRKDHSEAKLNKELGEDAFFYKCSKLLIYVYDKEQKITDTDNFIKSLERTKETAGKDIKVYVEQTNKLI